MGDSEFWDAYTKYHEQNNTITVDWEQAQEDATQYRPNVTKRHLKDVQNNIRVMAARSQASLIPTPDFFGPSWDQASSDNLKKRIINDLKSSKPIVFGKDGVATTKNVDKVTLHPLLLEAKTRKAARAAVKAYAATLESDLRAAAGEQTHLLNWAHGAEHKPYVRKMLWRCQLPNGRFTKAFPTYHGLGDDLTDHQREQRGNDMPVRNAPPEIQEVFLQSLLALAKKEGYSSITEYVTACDGVIYHFTINYMGSHTIEHVDEFMGDGPARLIWNITAHGQGLVYFTEHAKSKKNRLPLFGVFQGPGDCVGFSGKVRTESLHGVLKEGPICILPTTVEALTKDWHDDIRIVLTIRVGELSEGEKEAWHNRWASDYELPNPYKPQTTPTDKKQTNTTSPPPPLSDQETDAPQETTTPHEDIQPSQIGRTRTRAKRNNHKITPDTTPKPSPPKKKQTKTKSNKKNTTTTTQIHPRGYAPTHITNVYPHFEEVQNWQRNPQDNEVYANLKSGVRLELRLPTAPGDLVTITILAVGTMNNNSEKYRVAVVRMRNGATEEEEGEEQLEMLQTTAFPDLDRVKVYTHAHTHIHTHT
jgi:hypothetical protein